MTVNVSPCYSYGEMTFDLEIANKMEKANFQLWKLVNLT